MAYNHREPRTWRTEYAFSLDEGLTLCSWGGENCITFTDIRTLMKHLRTQNPRRDFKSEKWTHYGINYSIKSSLKESVE